LNSSIFFSMRTVNTPLDATRVTEANHPDPGDSGLIARSGSTIKQIPILSNLL
jgi:hypothetical protein